MLVRAKRLGEYNLRRRREGEVFELIPRRMKNGTILSVEDQFSDGWMEKVDPKKVVAPAPEKGHDVATPGSTGADPGPIVPDAPPPPAATAKQDGQVDGQQDAPAPTGNQDRI